jgi:hypothetical protein
MNTELTIGMVTYEALRVLVNELGIAKHVNREYDDKFGEDGAKIGNVLNVRRPPRYMTALGQALQIEDATETSVPVILNTQRHLGLAFGSAELKLSVDDFSRRFIRPGLATLSNFIDYDLCQLFTQVFNEVGTPGTVPNQALTYLQVGQRLSDMAVPFEDRVLGITPAMNATIVDALKGLFQSGERIREPYEKGEMGQGLGFDWFMDQNLPSFTTGTLGGTPVINGAGQTGSSIITNGWSNTTLVLNKGDIISFAGAFAVNPPSRQSTGVLAQWVVTAPGTSDGAGNLTIQVSGPSGNGVIVGGPWQNVTASPTNGGAVTIQGASATASRRGLAFHPDFATIAFADLPLPRGVDISERAKSKEMNASFRIVRAYDINQDRFPLRGDVLYGPAVLYPELACRVAS